MQRRIKLVYFIISLLSLCSTVPVYAGVNSDLHGFFNSLGYSANATSPTAYQGQMAGYYSGGSLYLRNQVRSTQIASVTLPGDNAGCGGIDLWSGGFSFVNAQQLENVMKNVVNF